MIKMAKARTIYIWEGVETITITKGYPTTGDHIKNAMVKHRQLFGGWVTVKNIEDVHIGEPKKLCVKDKIVDGWNVVKIGLDYLTHEPYVCDINPRLVQQVNTLRNEVEMWKNKYFEARRLIIDIDNKDRFKERVKKDFKFAGEAKGLLNPYDYGGMGGGFFGMPRYGMGMVPPPNTNPEE